MPQKQKSCLQKQTAVKIVRVLNKPSSVPQSGSNHLSGLTVTCKLKRLNPEGSAGRIIPSLFGLAPRGVYQASQSPDCWCALTAPFHPYRLPGGFLFYDTFPKVTLAGRYPARCPVEPGLSSSASRTPAIAFHTRKYIL